MDKVELVDGITIGSENISEGSAECLGLSFWLSREGCGMVNAILGAASQTIRIESEEGDWAALPLYKRHILPGINLLSGYPYARIFGNQTLFLRNLNKIINVCSTSGVAKLELTLSGDEVELVGKFVKLGHPAVSHSNQVIFTRQIVGISSLADAGDFREAFHGKTRWSINKAVKSGGVYRVIDSGSAQPAQDMYKRVMKEKGAPAYYGVERLQYIVDELYPRSQGVVYLVEMNGKVAGMAAVIYSGSTAHLKQVAVPREFSKQRLGDYLVAAVQYEASKAGMKHFDFMATPEFEPGVKEYKAKWGGTTQPVETIVISVKPVLSRVIDFLRWLSRKMASFR